MDFLFFETGDGGDMNYKNGDVELDKSLFTSVYLAHFGGNKDVIKKNDNSMNMAREWWGNLYTRDKEQIKLISNLETALRNTALNSLAPEKLKIAAQKDLQYLIDSQILVEFTVNISIESQTSVKIQETLIEPTGKQTDLSLIWDNTRQVVISDYTLPAAEKQKLEILNYVDGDIVNNQYLPIEWANTNVYAVNVGYVKSGVKTIVESNIIGRNSTVLQVAITALSNITLFVENAGFEDVRSEVKVNNPVRMFWNPINPGYELTDTVQFTVETDPRSPGNTEYTQFVLTYISYIGGTGNERGRGTIGTFNFGDQTSFVPNNYANIDDGKLELFATIPGTKIVAKAETVIN